MISRHSTDYKGKCSLKFPWLPWFAITFRWPPDMIINSRFDNEKSLDVLMSNPRPHELRRIIMYWFVLCQFEKIFIGCVMKSEHENIKIEWKDKLQYSCCLKARPRLHINSHDNANVPIRLVTLSLPILSTSHIFRVRMVWYGNDNALNVMRVFLVNHDHRMWSFIYIFFVSNICPILCM